MERRRKDEEKEIEKSKQLMEKGEKCKIKNRMITRKMRETTEEEEKIPGRRG